MLKTYKLLSLLLIAGSTMLSACGGTDPDNTPEGEPTIEETNWDTAVNFANTPIEYMQNADVTINETVVDDLDSRGLVNTYLIQRNSGLLRSLSHIDIESENYHSSMDHYYIYDLDTIDNEAKTVQYRSLYKSDSDETYYSQQGPYSCQFKDLVSGQDSWTVSRLLGNNSAKSLWKEENGFHQFIFKYADFTYDETSRSYKASEIVISKNYSNVKTTWLEDVEIKFLDNLVQSISYKYKQTSGIRTEYSITTEISEWGNTQITIPDSQPLEID